jgi:hypothetical protein
LIFKGSVDSKGGPTNILENLWSNALHDLLGQDAVPFSVNRYIYNEIAWVLESQEKFRKIYDSILR